MMPYVKILALLLLAQYTYSIIAMIPLEQPKKHTTRLSYSYAHNVHVHPQKNHIIYSRDNKIIFYDVTTKRILCDHSFSSTVRVIAQRPDGKQYAVATQDGYIYLISAKKEQAKRIQNHSLQEIHALTYSSDGSLLFGNGCYRAYRWDLKKDSAIKIHATNYYPKELLYLEQSQKLVTCSWKGFSKYKYPTLQYIGASTLRRGKKFSYTNKTDRKNLSKDSISSLTINSSQTIIASAAICGTIQLWDPQSRKALKTIYQHNDLARVAFSHDGTQLASASGNSIVLHDVASGKKIKKIHTKHGPFNSLAFGPDDTWIALGSTQKEKPLILHKKSL